MAGLGVFAALSLSVAGGDGRDVALGYDGGLMNARIEKIDLSDEWLVQRWGKTIYRVLLISVADTDGGKWTVELS